MSACNLAVNGRKISVSVGDTLVDAGLAARLFIPHDCCAGQCETCRVRVVEGAVDDKGTRDGDTVLACQATIVGPAAISFDQVPEPTRRQAKVARLRDLSDEVVEVVLSVDRAFEALPGQYIGLTFSGFPRRDYSLAPGLDAPLGQNELAFHIRRYPQGKISSALGTTIGPGHGAQIRGPFGSAFYRAGAGRLVLVAGGTGFAPIAAIAEAAVAAGRAAETVIVVGARDTGALYMVPALERLEKAGVELIVTLRADVEGRRRDGRATDAIPQLGPRDIVYCAGASGLVEAVRRKARDGLARFHADAFTPAAEQPPSMVDRVMGFLRAPAAGRAQVLSPRPDTRPVSPTEPIPAKTEPLPAAGLRSFIPRFGRKQA